MKAKLILLAEPILVRDEEISYNPNTGTEGNFFCMSEVLSNIEYGVKEGDKQYVSPFIKNVGNCKSCRRIIAGIPGLPSIDFSALSEEDCKKIGWIDVEKLANESFPVSIFDDLFEEGGRIGFKEGFKKAQSLNEKKFSEEDIIKAYEAGEDAGYVRGSDGRDDSKFLSIEELLQSLSQPKEVDVEVEMEQILANGADHDGQQCEYKDQPKITNNSIKVIKVL